MKMFLNNAINAILGLAKLEIRRRTVRKSLMPVELSKEECQLIDYIKENRLSMGSYERLWATAMACKHVMQTGVPGDFVECGVWRGGNALLAASLFKLHGEQRNVILFDTFSGMTEPTKTDCTITNGSTAIDKFRSSQRISHNEWCYASINDVKKNFSDAGVLSDNISFVKGDVLQTLLDKTNIPEKIAVLRLDTDWYESTKIELEVLYPRLMNGGALIIDDYGHWAGAKKATDEYFSEKGARPLLQYTDETGRMGVKP